MWHYTRRPADTCLVFIIKVVTTSQDKSVCVQLFELHILSACCILFHMGQQRECEVPRTLPLVNMRFFELYVRCLSHTISTCFMQKIVLGSLLLNVENIDIN